MKITLKEKVTDPVYPIMHGKTPTAKEFNKRMKSIWIASPGQSLRFDFEQVATILLEMFSDDYDKRHASRAKKKTPTDTEEV